MGSPSERLVLQQTERETNMTNLSDWKISFFTLMTSVLFRFICFVSLAVSRDSY